MILVDEHEPDNMVKLMKQSVTTVVSPLNHTHRSDFFFGNHDGKTFQFSRKQAGELIGNIDEAERQLADYYPNADYNYQIVEGWISPLPIHGIDIRDHSSLKVSVRELGQKLYCYQVQPNGHIERGHSFSTVSASMLYAWLHRLDAAGISTYWTTNWVETARLLVVLYKNEQKPPEDHHTLTRIIRPHLYLKKEKDNSGYIKEPEPLVKALVFLSDAYKIGVGEKKAKAIEEHYVNLVDIAMADVSELAQVKGIGNIIAKKLLTALGRTL